MINKSLFFCPDMNSTIKGETFDTNITMFVIEQGIANDALYGINQHIDIWDKYGNIGINKFVLIVEFIFERKSMFH